MFMMVESLLMCIDTSYELRGCETTFSNIILLTVEHRIIFHFKVKKIPTKISK